MRFIPRKRAAVDWFNLFSVSILALVAGFALYFSCGPVPGKIFLYTIAAFLGVIGLISNFAAAMKSLPDLPADSSHSQGHSH